MSSIEVDRVKKVILWRICSITITLLSGWAYTGSFKDASVYTLVLHPLLIIAHYIFESIWDKLQGE
jgi:uncharacterized membrane protein